MKTITLLVISNIFMTIAWYGHLKYKSKPLMLVILISWSIALFDTSSKCLPTGLARNHSVSYN